MVQISNRTEHVITRASILLMIFIRTSPSYIFFMIKKIKCVSSGMTNLLVILANASAPKGSTIDRSHPITF
jgi:hypothetical protein